MIAIPNIDMPKACWVCPQELSDAVECRRWEEYDGFYQDRHPNCPLIEIDDEIWEELKPKIETMSFAKRGWITDDSNT